MKTPSANTIRRTIREMRNTIPKRDRAAANSRVCKQFRALPEYVTAKSVGGYLAFDGEADPLGLMLHAHAESKRVFVPIIVEKNKPLMFAPWSPQTAMKLNRFGICEPDIEPKEWIEANRLDFVITPLVAFDESCNRLGVGGGFYDRSFAFLKEEPKSTTLIGFAFEIQKVEAIPSCKWDIRLNAVATESDLYRT